MNSSRPTAKLVAILAILAFVAVSCGGDTDPAETDTASEPTETVIEAIPTTPPITAPDESATDTVATAPEGECDDFGFGCPDDDGAEADAEAANPFEVTVLQVNDDVQIIPAFDAPNGNPKTIYDINDIDNIQLEYPLYAETAFGNRLALLVEEFDPSGAWARVNLPVRPNGTTAWVQTGFFSELKHDYHITIDISDNLVNVYKGEELLVEQLAVTGRESRRTPVVRAYIDEKIRGETLSPAYGDWVLSIAAFSEDLGTFGGGMPKLALHGTNQPDLMGQYVSSGCIRVPNEIISFIADTVPVGTIVDIVA